MCEEFKQFMMLHFNMYDSGKMSHFPRIEIKQYSDRIFFLSKKICTKGVKNTSVKRRRGRRALKKHCLMN